MDFSAVLFYLISTMICLSALAVVLNPSLVYSALSLVVTMIGLSFIFFLLQAYFIAGVQLVVYAGAVMVLFVMVLMLFNLKDEKKVLSEVGFFQKFSVVLVVGIFGGIMVGAVSKVSELSSLFSVEASAQASEIAIKDLSHALFSEYILAFEVLGLMLLLVAVGVVAISRAKGGTHAKP